MHERRLAEDAGAGSELRSQRSRALRCERERVGLALPLDKVLRRGRRIAALGEAGRAPVGEGVAGAVDVDRAEFGRDRALEFESANLIGGGERLILQPGQPLRLEERALVSAGLELGDDREGDPLVARIRGIVAEAGRFGVPDARLQDTECRDERDDTEGDRRRDLEAASRGAALHIRYRIAVNDATEPRGWWTRLPSWARIGLIAFVVVVVGLAALVAFRLATRAAPIPTGTTAVGELRPGSCLAEDSLDRDEYTVVSCGEPHPLQVFAAADLELDEQVYAQSGGALTTFGDAVCSRYLEYRLFLVAELDKSEYRAQAIDVPTPERYAAGDTEALCVIADEDGGLLTTDLYRSMP
jgi:hypothetical protein